MVKQKIGKSYPGNVKYEEDEIDLRLYSPGNSLAISRGFKGAALAPRALHVHFDWHLADFFIVATDPFLAPLKPEAIR